MSLLVISNGRFETKIVLLSRSYVLTGSLISGSVTSIFTSFSSSGLLSLYTSLIINLTFNQPISSSESIHSYSFFFSDCGNTYFSSISNQKNLNFLILLISSSLSSILGISIDPRLSSSSPSCSSYSSYHFFLLFASFLFKFF